MPREEAPQQAKGANRRRFAVSRPVPGSKAGRKTKGMLAGVISAVVIVAAGAGVVSASSLVPGPDTARELEVPLADVPAGPSTAVCPAPAQLLEGTPVGTDPQFSPVSSTAKSFLNALVLSGKEGTLPGSRVTSLSGEGLAEISKAPQQSQAPAAGEPALQAAVLSARAVEGVDVVAADAVGNQQPSTSALMKYSATDGDLRGIAAAGCQQPGNDYWILGANTTLGRTSILNLNNPSGTPATVSLDLYGKDGQIQAAGSRGLLVPPGTTRTVALAGLASGEASLAVHLRSTGGPVAATIQQSVLRGLTPGGVDFLSPGAAPGVRQVMTAIHIPDGTALKTISEKSGFEDAAPALQITVPGPADAVVEIRLYGSNGERTLPGKAAVTAKAGSVTEVPLTGVPEGTYTVSATSDTAMVAATRSARGLQAEEPGDFAWSPSSLRLGSQHIVALPNDGNATLVFGAPDGRAKIDYTAVTRDGKVRKAGSIDISGGTTATVRVPEKVDDAEVAGYVVSASGDPVFGSLMLGTEERPDIAIVATQEGAQGQEKVPVRIGY
ncbi:DUF5719 family protein [Arthrobacter sp. ISL-30]|uniref:DUF5719 family protein n=1 Tax=Arthrobacter sp. ISL-30 TaxID=2819109 RepID=UPI001BEA83CE|nr:DUF5719 family protein [Arthrobacter sp. ISL-30]MBT2515601.1 hypothetical protein [Arthrobacter sp. ISL-30]